MLALVLSFSNPFSGLAKLIWVVLPLSINIYKIIQIQMFSEKEAVVIRWLWQFTRRELSHGRQFLKRIEKKQERDIAVTQRAELDLVEKERTKPKPC